MRDLSIRQLKLFLKVTEAGSFTETAQNNGISQPALSRAIREMELNLGIQLFNRNAKGSSLTVAGQYLVPIARRVTEEFDGAFSTLAKYIHGQPKPLLIGAIHSMIPSVVAPALAALKNSCPNARYSIMTGTAGEIDEAVLSGHADIGFSLLSGTDSRLAFTPITSDDIVLACRADQPLAQRDHIEWKDLEGATILTLADRSALQHLVSEMIAAENVKDVSYIECHEYGRMGQLLAQGMGVAVVPEFGYQLIGAHLAAIPIANTNARQLGIITRRQGVLARDATKLVDIAISQWASRPVESYKRLA